jgi:hypothetical protein
MTQSSSFPFLLSSSSSCHRLVTLITILLLNPLPIIHGAPTKKSDNDLTAVQRHKRQIYVDDDGIDSNEYFAVPEPEIVFEGLLGLREKKTLRRRKTKPEIFYLGCKYDENVCNQKEACFDGKYSMLNKMILLQREYFSRWFVWTMLGW